MASKVEQALIQEIAEVEAAIAATPLARQLARLKDMLALYRGLSNVSDTLSEAIARADAEEASPAGKTGRARSPETQAVIDAAKAFLAQRAGAGLMSLPTPIPTGHIYRHLTNIGVKISGKNPANNLSAILSNAPEFVSHGRVGWTLAENENPADAVSLTEEASTGLIQPAQGGEARPGGGT
jgi:hypothetical protein